MFALVLKPRMLYRFGAISAVTAKVNKQGQREIFTFTFIKISMPTKINLCFDFGAKSVVGVAAFSNDSVFGVSIENDAFSDFRCLRFQITPF